jgi:serine phosphatase RsbU (regulator of sigma subunit)
VDIDRQRPGHIGPAATAPDDARTGHRAPDPERLLALAELTSERLRWLQTVTAALSGGLGSEQVADVILDRGLGRVGSSNRGLWLLEPGAGHLRLVKLIGLPPETAARFANPPLSARLPITDCVTDARAVWCSSAAERDARWPDLAHSGGSVAFAVLPLCIENRCLGVLSLGYDQPHEFDPGERDHFLALAAQCAQALDRARLHDSERAAGRRLTLLAEAGRALGSSLELCRTVRSTTELVVGALGGVCVLLLPDELGHLKVASTGGPDVAHDLLDGVVFPSGGAVDRVFATGRSELTLTSEDNDPLGRLGTGPLMLVPLAAAGEPTGVLAVAGPPGAPPWRPGDLDLAEELGRRAGVAIQNARLFTERVEIADALQRSLLPPRLPAVDGLELAARYAPAGRGLDVGGDFYDVFRVTHDDAGPDDPDRERWAVMVGDVVGSGARAAAATAVVRHTARAVSPYVRRPAAVVDAINRALIDAAVEEQFATLAYGHVHAADGRATVELVNAGHPRPLVLRAGGVVEEVEAEGPFVGQFPGLRHEPVEVSLGPGDTLVLFTDGVLEARTPRVRHGRAGDDRSRDMFGERRLAHVLAGSRGAGADRIAAEITRAVQRFTGGDAADDLAVLVLKVADGDRL